MGTDVKADKDVPRSHKQNIVELLRDIELTTLEVAEEIGCSLNYAQNTLAALVKDGLCIKVDDNRFTTNYDKMSVRVYQTQYDQFDYLIPVSKIEPKRDPLVATMFGTPKKSYVMCGDGEIIKKYECGVLEYIDNDQFCVVEVDGFDEMLVNSSDIIWE